MKKRKEREDNFYPVNITDSSITRSIFASLALSFFFPWSLWKGLERCKIEQ